MLRDSTVAAVVRTRPRATPLAMITMRKSTYGYPSVPHIWDAYGAPLGGPSGRRSSTNIKNNKYMLFAGWEGRIVKNCDRGHSFSLYEPTLSRQITYLFFSRDKLAYNWVYQTLLLNWFTRRLQTIAKNVTSERASNSDTRQRKMY